MSMMAAIVARLKALRPKAGPDGPVVDLPTTDGRVGIMPIAGLRSAVNDHDDRFRRFLGIDPHGDLPPVPSRRSKRKFPPLLGRVLVASLFLDRDGVAWSDEEIARAHKAMNRAGEWIEWEAIRLGAAVHIDLADTYFVADDPSREKDVELAILPEGSGDGLFEAEAEVKLVAAASRAASRLGFADVADLCDRIGRRVAADARIWLIHPRSAGRSFVVSESVSGMKGVNLAICYAREADFPGKWKGPPFSDPVTFAHELLHLFGATDKYNVPLRQFPKGSVTDRDIMRLEHESLSRLRIDPGTAGEIGWGVQ